MATNILTFDPKRKPERPELARHAFRPEPPVTSGNWCPEEAHEWIEINPQGVRWCRRCGLSEYDTIGNLIVFPVSMVGWGGR